MSTKQYTLSYRFYSFLTSLRSRRKLFIHCRYRSFLFPLCDCQASRFLKATEGVFSVETRRAFDVNELEKETREIVLGKIEERREVVYSDLSP